MSAITFEFYGRLSKLANQSEYVLDTDTPISLDDALKKLAQAKPDISQNLERCACAVGDELISRISLIQDNTRVALLPPVAGG